MDLLKTMEIYGGLNRARAGGVDHSSISAFAREAMVLGGRFVNDAKHRATSSYRDAKVKAGTAGGKVSGPLNASRIRPEDRIRGGQKGGLLGGKRVNEMHPGHSRRNALKACHNRWHVARGIVQSNCVLCYAAAA